VQFWPRLENARPFVLSELQQILFVMLCRLEIAWRRPNPSRKTLWASRLEIAEQGSERENFPHKDWLKVLD
jgi:hypothetical protein